MKIINFQILSISDLILMGSLAFVFLIQVYFILRYYLKLARHRDKEQTENSAQVTIILQVRNEEDRIREIIRQFDELLPSDCQLLVINLNSEDNTLNILNVIAESNPKIKVTSLSQETHFYEKQVLNIGLKGASSPWIILASPYSENINPGWLSGLNSLIDSQTEAVIAYSNLERLKGYRNLICRLERLNQFMISGGWILAGKPFVFNQSNILFKKSLYFDTLGFRHKLNRNFANLELIFNENFRKNKVRLTTNPDLAVREKIEDDRGDHTKLLRKGVQIRQSLSFPKKFSLFTEDITRILIPILTTWLIVIHPEYWISILSLPIIYLIVLAISVKMLLNRLNERKIFLYSLAYIQIKPFINWWYLWSMHLIHRRSKWN
ncbi:MAG: glycosyltransferase [Prolixibacteraceae bacterium]